jgi:hypothetical protein
MQDNLIYRLSAIGYRLSAIGYHKNSCSARHQLCRVASPPNVYPLHMQCAAFVNLDVTFQIYYSERGFDRFERIRYVHDCDVCHIDGDAVPA